MLAFKDLNTTSLIRDKVERWSNLCAGGPSMMMLIHRICIAFSGFGSCINVDNVMRVSAAILLSINVHTNIQF